MASDVSRGRPSEYSIEIATEICSRLSEGETLRQVCRDEHMPAESTVRHWALIDYQGFFAQYAQAREIGYHSMADETLDIADDGTNDWVERQTKDGKTETVLDHEHIARSRLRFDARRWLLSKALPKVYGDRMEHVGAGGGPLQVQVVKYSDDE